MEKLRKIQESKKGILGLETVKAVMLGLLVLAILFIAVLLATTSLKDVVEKIDTATDNIVDTNTTRVVNDSSQTTFLCGTSSSDNFRNCRATVINFSQSNESDSLIVAANYTVTNCTVRLNANSETMDALRLNNTGWSFSGSCTYSSPNTFNTVSNLSSGGAAFFTNTGTFFSILVVVVIISLIAIVIFVVTKFSAGGSSGARSEGAGFGSDTLGGI